MSRTGHVSTEHGLLLRSSLWGERDRLATLFLPQLGVVRARAVSAALVNSKLGPLLFPPLMGSFTLAKGNSPVRIISGIEPIDSFAEWRGDSLRLACCGVMLAALEEMDAPEDTNAGFFSLVTGILRSFASAPVEGLAVFLVKSLGLLGLLEGNVACSACHKEILAGTTATPPDFSTFICKDCFNRLYGNKEVSAVFINASALSAVNELAGCGLGARMTSKLNSDVLTLIYSLAMARFPEMLPAASAALSKLICSDKAIASGLL